MGLLAAILVFCNFVVVLPRMRAVEDMIFHYYHSLPIAMNADNDRDGISDDFDDSDGDGIADISDPTPFGVGEGTLSEAYMKNKSKYGSRSE